MYSEKTIARFWTKVNRHGPDDCWEWTASRSSSGYGQFRTSRPRRIRRAHTISYELAHGVISSGLFVCHHCDNRLCVNPRHLFLGTCKENAQDAARKGRLRHSRGKGEENSNARLTEVDVGQIRTRIATGLNNREIGREFGVTHQMIWCIRRGKAWKHFEAT